MGNTTSENKRPYTFREMAAKVRTSLPSVPPRIDSLNRSPPNSIRDDQSITSSKKDSKYSTIEYKEWNPATYGTEISMHEFHPVPMNKHIQATEIQKCERAELEHFMFRMVFDGDVVCEAAKNFLRSSPGARVLDVGCGSGYWAKCVQEEFPQAIVYGTSKEASVKYENYFKFATGDILERLPFEDNTFDFVYQRRLSLHVFKHEYVAGLKELIRVTKPGGWIQIVELDCVNFNAGEKCKKFHEHVYQAWDEGGFDCFPSSNFPYYLSHVQELIANQTYTIASLPMNWGGKIGEIYGACTITKIFELEFLHEAMGITREEYRSRALGAYAEWKETQAFMNSQTVCFQKRWPSRFF